MQISKAPLGTKGARITTHVSLPGRFLVYMPTVDHAGVSRKVADRSERNRMRKIIHNIRPKNVGGLIARTAGSRPEPAGLPGRHDVPDRGLGGDQEAAPRAAKAPEAHPPRISRCLLRLLRDVFAEDFDRVIVDDETGVRTGASKNFVSAVATRRWSTRSSTTRKKPPIFDFYKIQQQLDKALEVQGLVEIGWIPGHRPGGGAWSPSTSTPASTSASGASKTPS